ncbi:MAG: glutamine ABC transporter ATP-binding protein GlnQ, partial [Pseudomonadota bacterium]
MSAADVDQAQPEADEAPIVRLAGVNKWFGAFHVLKNINLDVARG